jgi:cellulose synthase/poly-beta-1,6-N-acetylglucosamine synthase-like glycosyltransferase
MPLPFVSVIVPVYNAQPTIKCCLEALMAQDYPVSHYEVIVIDNKSRDASSQIISGYPQVMLLQENAVQGAYAARTLGISKARGEILAFIDADCVALPNWLSELVAGFSNSEIQAVGGQLKPAEPTNLVERFLAEVSNFHGNYQKNGLQLFPPLLTGNSAYRSKVVTELGGFDTRLETSADIDLAWRMQHRFGLCTLYNPEAVVFHHHHSTLPGMYRQYHRHGVGEIHIDAVYHRYPGYPRCSRYQAARISRQVWALVSYLKSFIFRLLKYPFRRDLYYTLKPVLLFVAEWANLAGKCQGLWETRFLRHAPGNAALRDW